MTSKPTENSAATSTSKAEPISCSLTRATLEQRLVELSERLVPLVTRLDRTADGLRLELAPGEKSEVEANDFKSFESDCCGFMEVGVSQRTEAGGVIMALSGPAGTAEFLHAHAERLAPGGQVGNVGEITAGNGASGDIAGEIAPTAEGTQLRERAQRLRRTGAAVGAGAVLAFVCCATPFAATAAVALGLGGAVRYFGYLDALGAALLVGAGLFAIRASWLKRQATRCGC